MNKTNKIDTNSAKQSIDLRDFAERYTTLHKQTATESAGPCPWCGGDDRFVVFADHYFCRQCGRKGDVYKLVMEREGVNFIQAHEVITGKAAGAIHRPAQPTQAAPATSSTWDASTQFQKALEAHKALIDGPGKYAQQARDYLQNRGIELATADAFKVGCRGKKLPKSDQMEWAILFPWLDRAGEIKAIRYRFLEAHEYTDKDGELRTENKTSAYGSSFAGELFGWQTVKGPNRNDVLIVCEGEMNCLSLWQAGGGLVDVLSAGSEGALKNLPDEVAEYAQQYSKRIVWADKPEFADAAALRIDADWSMSSPNGQDANDLLIAGKLDRLLVAMLKRIGYTLPSVDPNYRPPLPRELWRDDLEWKEAEALHTELKKTYDVGLGAYNGKYYVATTGEFK